MKTLREWITSFFGFSRMETNAFIILLPLMLLFLFSEPVYRRWLKGQDKPVQDHQKLDSLIASLTWLEEKRVEKSMATPRTKTVFHHFDPNTANENELQSLGLSKFLAGRIVRYREKGGVFRKPQDLGRIYGMDSTWFREARLWLTFPAEKPTITRQEKIVKVEHVDINTADSLQLMKVYGIGPALSRRILSFREKLGGFISVDQLKEVYGLDTSVVTIMKKKFFVTPNFRPVTINLNQAGLDVLISHPYIKRKEGQAIVSFRMQHGEFFTLDDLHQIQVLTPGWIEKVKPYLKIE